MPDVPLSPRAPSSARMTLPVGSAFKFRVRVPFGAVRDSLNLLMKATYFVPHTPNRDKPRYLSNHSGIKEEDDLVAHIEQGNAVSMRNFGPECQSSIRKYLQYNNLHGGQILPIWQ
jgi:hypothetical protein